MSLYNIIRKPLLNEKASLLYHENGKASFIVDTQANKIQIKKAIETAFKVTVEAVSVINVKSRKKRLGRFAGKTSAYKKAIVTLKEGDKIEYFEGA